MTISVLIPSIRNDYINKCLESLAQQQRKPDKIIIVMRDIDGELQKTVDDFAQKHLLYIEKAKVSENGAIAAINVGIKSCDTDILCFIDDDIQANPDWLKRIEAYYKNEEIGGVGGRDIIHSEGKILERHAKVVGRITWYGKIIGNHHNLVKGPREVEYLKGCNMSFRNKIISPIDKKLQTEEGIAEPCWEIDMAFNAKSKGYKIWYDPAIIVDHHPGTKEYHLDRRNLTSIRNETYLLFKNLPFLKKIIFIFYTFFIGNRSNPGFLIFLLEVIKSRSLRIENFKNKLSAKIKGIKLVKGVFIG